MVNRIKESLADVLASWGLALTPARPTAQQRAVVRVHGPVGDAMLLVGTLRQEGNEYVFAYDRAYADRDDCPPIGSFADKHRVYRDRHLWPFFEVRIPSMKREDVQRLLRERNLDAHDTLRVLGVLGKQSITTPYELEFRETAA